MPILYTPKPRQFHYKPRLYDPDLEGLERRKRVYAASRPENAEAEKAVSGDADLEYFQSRVRELDRAERQREATFSWRDLFRKREKPQFHYQSRLGQEGDNAAGSAPVARAPRKRIGRRFDFDDPEYFRPVPAGKIMIYAGLVAALILFIFF